MTMTIPQSQLQTSRGPSFVEAPSHAESLQLGLSMSELSIALRELNLKRNSSQKNEVLPALSGQKKRFSPAEVRRVLIGNHFRFPFQAKRIAFLMCKGGVGKTTLTYFLGLRLASYGARVLYIDSDPQSNLSLALRAQVTNLHLSERTPVLVDVLTKRCPLNESIVELHPHLHLLPSTAVNSLLERELLGLKENPVLIFDRALSALDENYDFILVDCAPALNIFNASVVRSADLMLLPFQLNGFSGAGLQQTIAEIKQLEIDFEFQTHIRAVLNCYNAEDQAANSYLRKLAEDYRAYFMSSVVRWSPEIQEALTFGKNIFGRKRSNARDDFDCLSLEILKTNVSRGVAIAQHR